MSSKIVYVSKTQHYLKVKKPLLERQRRARINKHLDELKTLIAEFQRDDAILRMDKAEMLESTIGFIRTQVSKKVAATTSPTGMPPMHSFGSGYMNAVNEVSRVMAATPGMSVELGKSMMTHLGCEFNRLLHHQLPGKEQQDMQPLSIKTKNFNIPPPMSPASSGYHSDCDESSMASPASSLWRPW